MNGRRNAEEERRKTYLAIETIVAARPRGLQDLGAVRDEILQFTQLSDLAVDVALRFLRNQRVIYRTEFHRWAAVPLRPGWCFTHGYKFTSLGECTKCMKGRLK